MVILMPPQKPPRQTQQQYSMGIPIPPPPPPIVNRPTIAPEGPQIPKATVTPVGQSSVSGLSSPPQATPSLPVFTPDKRITNLVKEAPIDTIVFDESNVDIALISDLIFEDIGATELANIARLDYIDGQEVSYSPIANLSYIRREFNPNNIISIGGTGDYFSRFGINLITRGLTEPYFDENGNLVIEIDLISSEEEVQVQVLSNGTIELVDE